MIAPKAEANVSACPWIAEAGIDGVMDHKSIDRDGDRAGILRDADRIGATGFERRIWIRRMQQMESRISPEVRTGVVPPIRPEPMQG